MKRFSVMAVLVGLLLVGAMATTATAVESDVEFREYSEISENASDVGAEFLPPEYERAQFFDWIVFPLIGAGVLITGMILVRYLANHPRFEREAEEKSRR